MQAISTVHVFPSILHVYRYDRTIVMHADGQIVSTNVYLIAFPVRWASSKPFHRCII